MNKETEDIIRDHEIHMMKRFKDILMPNALIEFDEEDIRVLKKALTISIKHMEGDCG